MYSSRALGDRDDKENTSGIRGYENGRVYVAYQNEGVSKQMVNKYRIQTTKQKFWWIINV